MGLGFKQLCTASLGLAALTDADHGVSQTDDFTGVIAQRHDDHIVDHALCMASLEGELHARRCAGCDDALAGFNQT